MSGSYSYVVLDVFTDTALAGNPLAVFPDAAEVPEREMQPLARELNLSETVFVLPAQHGGDARVRIFTPAAELPFAGHPVLGSAIVVGIGLGREHVTLETGAGPVPVALADLTEPVPSGWMHQPIPSWQPYERDAELLAALGLARHGLPVDAYVNGPTHLYVELADADELVALSPDLHMLGELGAVGVSCFTGAGLRFRTRVFAPGLGVSEDPATGSAAGPLAVHLARHGRIAFAQEIEIRQGAEIGRPSLLRARVLGTPERIERVEVGGSAVIVARGEFQLA